MNFSKESNRFQETARNDVLPFSVRYLPPDITDPARYILMKSDGRLTYRPKNSDSYGATEITVNEIQNRIEMRQWMDSSEVPFDMWGLIPAIPSTRMEMIEDRLIFSHPQRQEQRLIGAGRIRKISFRLENNPLRHYYFSETVKLEQPGCLTLGLGSPAIGIIEFNYILPDYTEVHARDFLPLAFDLTRKGPVFVSGYPSPESAAFTERVIFDAFGIDRVLQTDRTRLGRNILQTVRDRIRLPSSAL